MATALRPLTKAGVFDDPQKALVALGKAFSKTPPTLVDDADGGEIIQRLRLAVETRIERAREHLGPDLAAACEVRGLTMRVVKKDGPVEVRIPPLAVVIDRDKGKAVIQFAREKILETSAEADAILDGHQSALRQIDGAFSAPKFHDACRRAWRGARAAGEAVGDRVEIVDFLPYLAIEMQKPAFKKNPTSKGFRDYTRAQFAWDVLRLRRERMLVHSERRLNLGVATGTSASKKARVIFFEDEDGAGEYKLTIFFTREQE